MHEALSIEHSLAEDFTLFREGLDRKNDVEVFTSYLGDLEEGVTYSLTNKLEEILSIAGIGKGLVRKMFSIVIEGLQNIRLHGEFDDEGQKLASFILWKEQDNFHMRFTNLLDQGDKERIRSMIKSINSKDKQELKHYYLQVMNNGMMSKAGGAGLGLITMGMKSQNPIELELRDVALDLSIMVVSIKML